MEAWETVVHIVTQEGGFIPLTILALGYLIGETIDHETKQYYEQKQNQQNK